jgi:NAD(P)-dependent dehydrogenase (short-subunit alcohol dehydrogenase family)
MNALTALGLRGKSHHGTTTSGMPESIKWWSVRVINSRRRPFVSLLSVNAGLRGRVAVITGGAAGIGSETARNLARNGAHVAVLDIDVPAAELLAAELPGNPMACHADVADRQSVDDAIRAVVERYGRIDILIANAGIAGPTRPFLSVDAAEFERVIQINFLGVSRTIHAALPHLLSSSGYLLAVSSMVAAIPAPSMAAYGSSKAAIDALGRALRVELAATGVDVGVAHFGLVQTGLISTLRAEPGLAAMMESLPGPMSRPIPASRAAQAIVDGVQRRRAHVYQPGWVRGLLGFRGQLAALDGFAHRLPAFADMIVGGR